MDKILKRNIILENFYFSLDGHNFFKRKDRYKRKVFLIICFGYLSFFNLFEIIVGMIRLSQKKNSADFDNTSRVGTLILNMVNIIFILLLTTYTVVKLRVLTVIYY